MSQLTIFVNVPCDKWSWFLPLSNTITEQFEGKTPDWGAGSLTAHTNQGVTKFSFTCPANFPVLACFYSKWWCMHKICFACDLAMLMRWAKILICTICSVVLMSQNVLYIVWKKAWSFFRYTEFFKFQKLTITLQWKKPGFSTQSLWIKTGRYSQSLTVIYKTHPVEIKQEQSRDIRHLFKDDSCWYFSLWKANCILRNS